METRSYIMRDEQWVNVAKNAMKIQQERKRLELEEKKAFDLLRELSENKDSKGRGFVFTCIKRQGSIDYSKIPLLQLMDLEPFRREASISWKLSLELYEENNDTKDNNETILNGVATRASQRNKVKSRKT